MGNERNSKKDASRRFSGCPFTRKSVGTFASACERRRAGQKFVLICLLAGGKFPATAIVCARALTSRRDGCKFCSASPARPKRRSRSPFAQEQRLCCIECHSVKMCLGPRVFDGLLLSAFARRCHILRPFTLPTRSKDAALFSRASSNLALMRLSRAIRYICFSV